MQKLAYLSIGLLLVFSLMPSPSAAQDATTFINDLPIVEPEVWRAMKTNADTPLRVIVVLRPAGMTGIAPTADMANVASRTLLIETLQANFRSAMGPVEALLAEAQNRGDMLARQDLWIIRATALTVRPAFVRRLMTSPAVAEIRLDRYVQYVTSNESATPENGPPPKPTWGLTRIRAPEVWATLGISGTGAVVAIMDTGVDLLHPALAANYRGNLGRGLYDHTHSWHDVVNGGIYPYDDHGHGTHVAGTAAGAGNIGVAPAAQWIGVKVLSGEGYGYNAWIHAGFQWLLAPGGDPTLAPDVINCSWASTLSSDTSFAEDIALLKVAGILPLFAANNTGPGPGTIGAPASNPNAFAVGASDPDDEVPYFSSRGPSPWGEIKPNVAAPGVKVLSSSPGGVYAERDGTSMATPHVTGLVALLRSADPMLSVEAISTLITQTAVSLSTTLPNNDSGWGRIDAFAAVAVAAHAGLVVGNVAGPNRQGIAGATLVATPHNPQGTQAHTLTTANGDYMLALVPGIYDISASAFGYLPATQWYVPVFTNTQQHLDFTLLPLPTGTLQGRVTVSGTHAAPTRTVVARALATPVTATIGAGGEYSLKLPTGIYSIEMRGLGYYVATASVTVVAGETTTRDFVLTPAPTLLLVDEGGWYYESQTAYWKAALDALAYPYDEQRIKHPPAETPISTTLTRYDIVLWSSPKGSPGLVKGSGELNAYLQNGGRLLLSGQDVAYFDGGGYATGVQPYLVETIGAGYVRDDASVRRLTGLGPFSGMTVTIEGGDGANNQAWPDVVAVHDPDKAELLWRYTDGSGGGIGTSICTPYRALFFSFGYEAIATQEQRREVLARSLDWLQTAPPTVALTLDPLSAPMLIGMPGETVTHTLRLRHTGYGGVVAPITLTLDTARWPATVTPPTVTLRPCSSITLTVMVTIPADTGVNVGSVLTLTAATPLLPTSLSVTLRTKTPAPVLLVDDDRWYPMEGHYIAALSARGVPFDVWDTAGNRGGVPDEQSPTLAILQRYLLTVWFTGYDWYAPILPQEAKILLAYLNGGGRLLLSSQDFLYYHNQAPLMRRFGVKHWDESRNPTHAFGVPDQPTGGPWGPVKLDFPFKNWADAIEPLPEAVPVIRGQLGQPLGIAREITASRTLFYAFPLETLPLATRAAVLADGVDWLSPLGKSRWTVTPTTPLPGERVTHTLVLYNDAAAALTTTLTHTLPVSVTLDVADLPPTWEYAAATRTLSWRGTPPPQTPITFTWVVSVTEVAGAIPLSLTLGLPAWGLQFNRENTLYVAGADLSASAWFVPEWATIRAGTPVTLTFALRNAGPGDIDEGTVRLWLTHESTPLTATLPYTRGWNVSWWEGNLAAGETRTLTLPLRAWQWDTSLRIDAVLEDGGGQRWERRLWLNVKPWRCYLPVIYKRAL